MMSLTKFPPAIRDFVRKRFLTPRVPAPVARRFTSPGAFELESFRRSLEEKYFSRATDAWFAEGYLSTPEGKSEIGNEIQDRLNNIRTFCIPWLNGIIRLSGSRILEIGCGTGCASVALAEQGSELVAVDISEASLAAARERCGIHGVNAEFVRADAVEVHRVFGNRRFDLIIFFASLEHMLHEERIEAMRRTWEMLPAGGMWALTETPNRLWFFDEHTSRLPFYMWLPDDLAAAYAGHSPRTRFRELYGNGNGGTANDLLRRGRGLSYHEFDLAMGPVGKLDVRGCSSLYLRNRSLLGRFLWKLTMESRYEALLAGIGPRIHRGFFQNYLNLVIRKP